MKKQILQSDESGAPYTQFPEIIELMEIQEKLHEQGEEQKKNELIDLKQTYLCPATKPLLVILILFFYEKAFTQSSNYVINSAIENEAIIGVKVGIIFMIGIGLISLLIYKMLSTAKPPT